MDRSHLPASAFIDPHGRNRAEIEALLGGAVEALLDYSSRAAERAPMPDGVLDVPLEIPEEGGFAADLFVRIREMMLSSMNAGHPGYMGHMDTIASTMSVVGDLLASALNNNMLSLEMSPAFSRLEDRLLRVLALRFGLGAAAGGVMAGGGTLANLQALTVARNHAFDCFDGGIQGLSGRPVVLASENAHVSFLKATMLLGAGTRGLVGVRADAQGRMEMDDLWRRLQECRGRGDLPYCVVGVAGTTVTGSIDPLEEIGALCREEGLWFHVDAAFGGAAILSEKHKHRLRGVDQADSLTWNPQKWLYVAKTCAMVLFRRAEVLKEHYRLPAPYMRAVDDFTNLGELSIQGTRRPDALKLWLTLAHLGRRGLAQLVDGSYELAERLAAAVDAREFLRRLSPTDVSIVCFTGPGGDEWNSALQRHLMETGTAFLSYPHLHGRRVLKAVTINPYTDIARIDGLMEAVDDFTHARGREPN